MRQAPVNGIKIGYRQFGTGPDLIMVIGDGAAMSLWTVDLLTELAPTLPRYDLFDNRGVGYCIEYGAADDDPAHGRRHRRVDQRARPALPHPARVVDGRLRSA